MIRSSPLWCAGLLWAAAVDGHTHLVGSVPPDHARLSTAPRQAILTFAEAVVLTSARLETPDGTQRALQPLPEGSVKLAHVPLPALGPGHYGLKWRATSDDGHVMAGEIHFSVDGPALQ